MKYFQVDASSTEFCGYDSTYYFKAEDEHALENSDEFAKMLDFMDEYINQDADPEDEDYVQDYVYYNISETTEEEYNLYAKENQF